MKKLLLTIFLSLISFTSAFSQTEKEIALENCADDTFINWEDESYKKQLGSRRGAIAKTWGKSKRGEELLQKGYALNKKLDNAKKSHKGEKTQQLIDGWKNMKYRAMNYIRAGYNHYGLEAYEIVEKTSIKKKTNNEVYADFLIDCEKLYNETPYGFILKWKNK